MKRDRVIGNLRNLNSIDVNNFDVREFLVYGDKLFFFDRLSGGMILLDIVDGNIDTIVHKGKGPLECSLPIAFNFYDKEKIEIVDRDLQVFKVIEQDSLLQYYRIGDDLGDAVILSENSFVITSSGPQFSQEILAYSKSDDHWNKKNISPKEFFTAGASITFDGFFTKSNCGHLVLASYLKPLVYVWLIDNYSKQFSQLERNFDLVYSVPEPELMLTETSVAPIESTIHLSDVTMTCSKVFILSYISDSEDYRYVDIYDVNDGGYEISFRLFVKDEIDNPKAIEVINDKLLYVLYENSIDVFELNYKS